MSSFYISATHKSCGKTTLSIGLCAAFAQRGHAVQAFKKGPDYIDPMWLSLASGRDAFNLDFYTQSHKEILEMFQEKGRGTDIQIVEGNKGLYDGLDLEGSNSNAAMAKHLKLPVVLVLNAQGTIRGVAPLILGYQAFDPEVEFAGVILNRVGGSRHESKLRAVVERYTDLQVIGAVPRSEDISLVERHLGLIPSNEEGEAREKILAMGEEVARSVDLSRLLSLPQSSLVSGHGESGFPKVRLDAPGEGLRIGIIRDSAFGFYYPDDLESLRGLGAELIFIDAINDGGLPDNLDGLFIGGGFPESFGEELSRNTTMLESVRETIRGGLPTYVECGGLMYLSEGIQVGSDTYRMVGVIPGIARMSDRPKGRGYTRLKVRGECPWGGGGDEICAHEFHYSELVEAPCHETFAFEVSRGVGITGSRDGLVIGNLVANYTHLRNTENFPWCEYFVKFIAKEKLRAQ